MFAVWMIALPLLLQAQLNNYPPTPDKIYGQLFIDVQMQQVFPDGKTFVDCTPKRKVADIMYQYGMMRGVRQHMQQFIENNSGPKYPEFGKSQFPVQFHACL